MTEQPRATLDDIGSDKDAAAAKTAPDEKDQEESSGLDEERAHELALMKARMGPIGCWIGSEDTALTISFSVLIFCFFILAVAAIASIWNPTVLTSLSADLFKVILAIAGYIFGKLHAGVTRSRK